MQVMADSNNQTSFEELFKSMFLDDWKVFKKDVRQNFTAINKKLADNTTITEATRIQTEKTNGKVLLLEDEVKLLKAKAKAKRNMPAWYTDQKLLYLAAASIFVFLLILAAVLGVKVPGQ